ncbi:MAG: c-type cytochrome [Acidobacteriota bacterium]|nr:c-type cytochrome [Acidobacteriota bacterium]
MWALLAAGVTGAAGCGASSSQRMGFAADPVISSGTYRSNGQQIFLTGTSASGSPITYQGGPSWMPAPMMMRIACATCHGTDGHGGQVFLFAQSFVAPDITWPVLTGPYTDHPPYTVATVEQAITHGIDPGGNPLDPEMPRWSMSASDLNDLVAYLQTLK